MATVTPKGQADTLPGHLELPDHDDAVVNNFRELPQSLLLTDSLLPILRARHPDGRFAIGQDCGIYWRLTDPPQRGAVCPRIGSTCPTSPATSTATTAAPTCSGRSRPAP